MRKLVATVVAALVAFGSGTAGAVINGSPPSSGEWPSIAALYFDQGFHSSCAGSLVHPEWVLSAAHCFYNSRQRSVPNFHWDVEIGETEIPSGRNRIRVQPHNIVLHPGYDDLRGVHDLALIHLDDAATADLMPLAAAGTAVTPGTSSVVIGYGATQPDGAAAPLHSRSPLLEAEVPVVGDADCAAAYRHFDASGQLCAGEPGTLAAPGADACHRDDGGPLMVQSGGEFVQVGITSFGGVCGVAKPGVYTEVAHYREWIDAVLAIDTQDPGEPPIEGGVVTLTPDDPENPDPSGQGADSEIFRVAASDSVTEAITQAAEVSFSTFNRGRAGYAVLARADVFADALGGSSLARGVAPLLFTGSQGNLPAATVDELLRAVGRAAGNRPSVFILGGPQAIPPAVDDELEALGFDPVRLAGQTREETAVDIAQYIWTQVHRGSKPFDTLIVATAQHWPDAVAAGQIGAMWEIPILLTAPGALHPLARYEIERQGPNTVLVLGGPAAISDGVFAEIQTLAPNVVRLAGNDRLGTAAAVLRYHLDLFPVEDRSPDLAVSVNLWRGDGFAHTLSASMLAGRFGGIFLPVDGVNGERLAPEPARAACGLDIPIVVAGGTDLISEAAAQASRAALGGQCP